jgi:Pyruvate phosphate dikinase, AMP/ATP-binding domain
MHADPLPIADQPGGLLHTQDSRQAVLPRDHCATGHQAPYLRDQARDREVVAKTVATKQPGIHALPAGGTQEQAIDPARQEQPALTDAQAVRLAQLGRRIEAHFGRTQDRTPTTSSRSRAIAMRANT